jgi:ribosome biogenesis GTPase A
MIIGIPNVGKSTFINRMAAKNIAKTGAKPGLTRSQQWVKLADDIELLDTPGVLFPRIQTKADELNLALTAGIRDDLVGEQLTAEYLIYRLRSQGIIDRLKGLTIENTEGLREEEILRKFARIRGFIEIGDQEDMHKASVTLLNMFRESKIGALSLNHVDEMLEMERLIKERAAKKEHDRLEDLAIKAEFKRKKEEEKKNEES